MNVKKLWSVVPLDRDDLDGLEERRRLSELSWDGHASTEEEKAWQERFYASARFVGVRHEGVLVGSSGWYDRTLTVPGGAQLSVLGLTEVSVLSTHRRQGVLRSMMRDHFGTVREQGAAASVLIASDGGIYGRFGYGAAAFRARRHVAGGSPLRGREQDPGDGSLRLLREGEVATVLVEVFEAHRASTAGELTRPSVHWEAIVANVVPGEGGLFPSGLMHVVYERDERALAYASYRMDIDTATSVLDGTVVVEELVALDGAAEAAVLQYFLGLDHVRRVVLRGRPLDDPLRWHLADPNRLCPVDEGVALWLRIVNVVGALSQREYGAAGTLAIDVHDPADSDMGGRFRLTVDEHGAGSVERTQASPDLAMGMDDLSACYLGGVSLTGRAWAGGVTEHRDGAIALFDRMFLTATKPRCSTTVY